MAKPESDILIFSDKDCTLNPAADVETAWRRWHKAAVHKSATQAVGAERWIRNYPQRIFRDKLCTAPLPIALPADPTFHRILTCRGAAEAARLAFTGSRGSLMITNEPLAVTEGTPFRIGAFDDGGRMFHIFDEVALDAVLRTLDTVDDFVSYLRRRESLFRRVKRIISTGEEDLLAFYLLGCLDQSGKHQFDVPEDADLILIEESHWNQWIRGPQRPARDEANHVSYFWDYLITRFSAHVLAGDQPFAEPRDVPSQEELVRWLARENRLSRRALSSSLLEMLTTAEVGQIRRRYAVPVEPMEPYRVFLVFHRPTDVDRASYGELRRTMLRGCMYVVKHLHEDARDIIGIALGVDEGRMSEDAIYLDVRAWSEAEAHLARELHEHGGVFKDPTRIRLHTTEYPIHPAEDEDASP